MSDSYLKEKMHVYMFPKQVLNYLINFKFFQFPKRVETFAT